MTFGQERIDQVPVEVEIRSLSTADSPRISGEVAEHVEALSVAETPLPPIIVHRSTMRVIDGAHRLRAAALRGDDKIAVTYFDGTDADAFVLAVESNIAHGLPLSIADRKRAAQRIVASHPQWSDRMIASVTGVASATVAEIRKHMPAHPLSGGSRIGRDGRIRPLNGAEGRRRASELIAENPGLSLRQVARAVGISPETARDVRDRLRTGEDPLPSGKRVGTPRSEDVETVATGDDDGDGGVAVCRARIEGSMAMLNRLKGDPALRFSETGRALLRLFNAHMLSQEQWEKIVDNVPPHCQRIVVGLARDCAGLWREVAVQVNRRGSNPWR